MCPRVWPGVWIAVKPDTDIGPSAVSASSTGTCSGGGMMAATTRMKRCIHRMSNHARPGPATQLGHAADVIGMPVCQQDRMDLADRSARSLDGTRHFLGPPGDAGVHQHYAVIDDHGVGVHVPNRNFNHAVNDFAHVVIIL